MMSLMPPRTCTRYMSPTRLGRRIRSTSVSPVPPRRLNSTSTSPNSRSRRTWKGSGIPPGVKSYREILEFNTTRVNAFSSQKNDLPHNQNNLTAVSVSKTGKSQYLDVHSAIKRLTSLHIDIPGLANVFQRSEPKAPKNQSQDDTCLKSQPIGNNPEAEKHQNVSKAKSKSNQYWSEDVQDIKREQHSFEDAMLNAHESDSTYFLDTSPDNDRSTSQSKSTSPLKKKVAATLPETDSGPKEGESPAPSSSFVDQIKQYMPSAPFNVIPIPGTKSPTKEEIMHKKREMLRKQTELKASVDRRTRALVMSLKRATSDSSKLSRLDDFCNHLLQNPKTKTLATKELVIPALLKIMTRTEDQGIKQLAHQALTMVGYTFPVRGRGIRILSIDGGGTRGLMAIQLLEEIEKLCGKPMRETFDYICGVSTGALLATMLSVHDVPLKDCADMYKQFSKDMFSRSRWVGASKLVTSHAYYDHVIWEKILQETIGVSPFIESGKDLNCPKLSLVSTLMNRQTIENYLFRNYTYMDGSSSHYPGSYHHKLWEGIRASSAAPTYYQEFKLGDFIHQDGGVLTNNPTAIAIHEARLLWPDVPIQCVISLGTGRYRPTGDPEPSVGLRDIIDKMVQSATDTEAVHTMLQDLLPPSTYFRFNPYMSENFTLDEIREEKWEQMKNVTDMYIRKNELKLQTAARILALPKLPHHKVRNWAKIILDEKIRV